MLAPLRQPGLLIGFHIGRAERTSLAQHAGATIIEIAQKGWPTRQTSHTERITAVRGPGVVNLQGATLRPEGPGGKNGVRTKLGAQLTPGNWRIYWCTRTVVGKRVLFCPMRADRVAEQWADMEYDLSGSVASAVLRFTQDPDRAFCSEYTAEQIGLSQSWSFHPARLHDFVAGIGDDVTDEVFAGTFHMPTGTPDLPADAMAPAA